MNKVLEDIINYKKYLESIGIEVSLCLANDTLYPRLGLLVGDFLHRSSYCAYVKSDDNARRLCVHKQVSVREKILATKDAFCGCCHAGMYERVYRVGRERFVGFLSVSGLRGDEERTIRRIDRICANTSLSKDKLYSYMLESITPASKMSIEMLDTLVMPLVYMLNVLAERKEATGVSDRVKAYIDSHYNEPIKVEDLARIEKYSVSRLSHLFKDEVGMSVGEYLKRVRIDVAIQLLTNTSMQITDVASHVGYEDSDYFSKVFRSICGKSPREYRNCR